MSEHKYIGKSIPRLDTREKVTGQAKFTADYMPANALHCKILRSIYPHARILSIDTSEAEELPGVRAVITAKDVPAKRYGFFLESFYTFPLDGIVRHVGDPIAAVAAETREIAEEAIDLIDVKYEELPAVFYAEDAMKEGAPIIHPNLLNYTINLPLMHWNPEPDIPNCMMHFRIRNGDVEEGFKKADLIVEDRYESIRVHHCQMETHRSLAWIDPKGIWNLMASMQTPSITQAAVAKVFDLPLSKVRVLNPWLGGGFGGKSVLFPHDVIALTFAKKTGRPVEAILTRAECFYCTETRMPIVTYIKDGVKKDGTLVARQIKMICDVGAYGSTGALIVKNAAFGAVGTYRIPHFKLDSYGVFTNLPNASAYRGVGTPEITWAMEQQMDVIAEKLGIDPVKLRQKNILKEGEKDVCGQITHSIGASECLKNVAEAIEWGKKSAEKPGPWKVGKGLAMGNKYTVAGTFSSAIVKVFPDGMIEVRENATAMGQGTHTGIAQIAAEEFDIPIEWVKIVFGDTDVCPYDPGSWSSRTLFHTGNAVIRACQDAKRQMFDMASKILMVSPEDLALREGIIYRKSLPSQSIPVSRLFFPSGVALNTEILGRGWYQTPIAIEDENGQSERMVAYYAHCPYAVEVAVNTETGEVRVLKAVASTDQGRVLNPKMCEQQVEGGMAQGLGGGVYEEMLFDKGVMINPSYADYKIPTVMEIPGGNNVKVILGGVPHREGPYGAKGIGEVTMAAVAPAIGNAIYNAVGIRIKSQPTSRLKVWKALQEKKK